MTPEEQAAAIQNFYRQPFWQGFEFGQKVAKAIGYSPKIGEVAELMRKVAEGEQSLSPSPADAIIKASTDTGGNISTDDPLLVSMMNILYGGDFRRMTDEEDRQHAKEMTAFFKSIE